MVRSPDLLMRLDGLVDELVAHHPGRRVTREGLVRELLAAVLDDRALRRQLVGQHRRERHRGA